MSRCVQGYVTLLAAVAALSVWPDAKSRAAEGDEKTAYDQAYQLEVKGEYAEAEQAYAKFAEQYPGTPSGLAALSQRAGLLAVRGETEESVQVYVKCIEGGLKASGIPIEQWPSADAIRADARQRVARAILGSHRSDRYALAKKQYEVLARTASDAALAAEARRQIDWLNSEAKRESSQAEKVQPVAAVIKAYEAALRQKDAAAVLALLAAPPKDNALRTALEAYFRGAQYREYTYEIQQVGWNEDLSKATVTTRTVSSARESGRKLFRVVKTAGGWRLEKL